MAAADDTKEILNALISVSDDVIWATELALMSGGRRVDFWTLGVSASRGFRASAYEIKVSRADFKRDTDDKQSGALKYSDRFWYVTPPGLLTKSDLPEWAGLQEWDGKLFHSVRKAPMRPKAEPDWEFVVSVLRNSGDCRRDIGLMKAQIAFFEFQNQSIKTQQKMRNERFMERLLRKGRNPKTMPRAVNG